MRVVLYAHDMEPITILDLSHCAYDFLHKHGSVRLAVPMQCSVVALTDGPIEADFSSWIVEITAERLHRNGERHMMLFTRDEEQAMLLKAAFLPGQQHALREKQREAFAQGFLHAISKLAL